MNEQYQILTRPRHLRYIFFIDDKYPYDKVITLINSNLRNWGGRYNPIVPLATEVLSDEYKQLVSYYDPDIVFYSKNVDVNLLKRLRLFNPLKYVALDDDLRRTDIRGVDSSYLLSQIDKNRTVLLPTDIWQTESPLLSFYKINFGPESSLTNVDDELTKNFKRIWVGKDDIASINKLFVEQRPVNKSYLSKANLNTRILRAKDGFARYSDFEIVVSKDKTSPIDLLYFWNRQLFQCRNILYATQEEIGLLCTDKFFGELLRDLSGEADIEVVSFSLSESELNAFINDSLKKTTVYKRFMRKNITRFPFEILDGNGLFEREYGENTSFQSMPRTGGLVQIPKLSFTDKVSFYPQEWVIDIEERLSEDRRQNSILFPPTLNGRFGGLNGRVNHRRNISAVIHNQINTSPVLEASIPNFIDIARQLIQSPFVDGDVKDSKYVSIGYSDQSNRLMALIGLFSGDLRSIEEFFSDKFWVDIFEYLSTNEKAAGDSMTFAEIKFRCIRTLAENGITLGKRDETHRNEENLSLGLKHTLKELTSYKVFLKGFKLKCRQCSSILWYHIDEVKESIRCKGCLQEFTLPVEPEFAYKLNDLVKNNLFQTKVNRDGNLTVIRTLAALKSLARSSFDFTAQLNLFTDIYSNKPDGDIDIFCVADGTLIIGEAKHNSAAFFEDKMKPLETLVEVTKQIRPGKVVLSCYEDSNGKLAKAKQSLDHFFNKWEFSPEIEVFVLSSPDYFHLDSYRYFYH